MTCVFCFLIIYSSRNVMVSLVALPRAKVVSSRSQKRVSSSFGSKTAVNSSSGSRALTSADECRKQLFAEETKRPEDHAEIVRPVAEKSHLQIFDDHGPYSTRSSSKVTWDTVGVRITPSKRPTIDIGIGVGKVHRTASSDGSVPLHGLSTFCCAVVKALKDPSIFRANSVVNQTKLSRFASQMSSSHGCLLAAAGGTGGYPSPSYRARGAERIRQGGPRRSRSHCGDISGAEWNVVIDVRM